MAFTRFSLRRSTRYELARISHRPLGNRIAASSEISTRNEGWVPHICPVLADVGFHGCPPIALYQPQIFRSMALDALHSQGLRLVESHICQNRADMGHPGFVAERV